MFGTSAGVNVNAPVELLYANAPLPLGVLVDIDMSVNDIPGTAGAKVNVSKHGNYGVSSSCGSSNVLEFLGIKFSNNKDFLKKSIEKSGICILHIYV